MSGWNAGYGKEESFIEFNSNDKDKVKAVEKVCCAIMDGKVNVPSDIEVVVRCKDCKYYGSGVCWNESFAGYCSYGKRRDGE